MPPKLLFLIGCPRSGTTWLQLLLAQHPLVSTLEETHLFPEYVSPILAKRRSFKGKKRKVGLDTILDNESFHELCRRFVMQVLRVALDNKPGATFILEKTPLHLYHAEEILELFPDAYFLHLIRDPRSVVASLLNASRTWGKGWAPRDAGLAAESWKKSVNRARAIQNLTENYLEITYEGLCKQPQKELRRIMEAFQIPCGPDFYDQSVSACSKESLARGAQEIWSPPSMKGNIGEAVRRAELDGWKHELSQLQIITVEYRTWELMGVLGYRPSLLRRRRPPIYWYLYNLVSRGFQMIRLVA